MYRFQVKFDTFLSKHEAFEIILNLLQIKASFRHVKLKISKMIKIIFIQGKLGENFVKVLVQLPQ